MFSFKVSFKFGSFIHYQLIFKIWHKAQTLLFKKHTVFLNYKLHVHCGKLRKTYAQQKKSLVSELQIKLLNL